MTGWKKETYQKAIFDIARNYGKHKNVRKEITDLGYDFNTKKGICLYIADVVLKNYGYSETTVAEWTRRNGPDNIEAIERLEEFLGVCLIETELNEKPVTNKEETTMMTQYSTFTKEKLFEVHAAIMKYIPQILDDMDSEELEMEFYKMDEILQLNRVAIPKEIFNVFDYFLHEYLYCRVFGFNKKKSKEGLIEDFDALDEKIKKESPDKHSDFVCLFFQIKNMYAELASKYMYPILTN